MTAPPRPVHMLASRRHFLAAAAAGLGALSAGGLCRGDDRPPVSADVERAVNNGFKFLDRQQRPEKAFEGESGVTVAARTLLAFLAAGNVPDVGRHGLAVQRAVDWLLDQQGKAGWYGPADRGLRPHLSATTAL